MLEIHPDPDRALSDGPEALTFEIFDGSWSAWRQRHPEHRCGDRCRIRCFVADPSPIADGALLRTRPCLVAPSAVRYRQRAKRDSPRERGGGARGSILGPRNSNLPARRSPAAKLGATQRPLLIRMTWSRHTGEPAHNRTRNPCVLPAVPRKVPPLQRAGPGPRRHGRCQVTVSVDAGASQRPIGQDLDVAFAGPRPQDLNATLNRWGGNTSSRYNWQRTSTTGGPTGSSSLAFNPSSRPGGGLLHLRQPSRRRAHAALPHVRLGRMSRLPTCGASR
jgi:hypothetical protein